MNNQLLKVALYIGKGASHSWIWFVDTLRKAGITRIQFITDVDAVQADLLVISGGDPFALFSHITSTGVHRIIDFIKEGGTYVGICAGTYFALKFHETPYPWLNLIDSTIANFSLHPPPNIRMPHKYTVPYREGFVFHPVRDEVICTYKGAPLSAPLYGGPGIISADAQPLAEYTSFAPKTSFLCDRSHAASVFLGTTAVLSKKWNRGRLLLFGPHFEHPYFPQANKELISLLSTITPRGYTHTLPGHYLSGTEKNRWLKDLKRWISNGRLAAFGLGNYHWKIGEKIYDPERLAYFFETSFQLIKSLEQVPTLQGIYDLPERAQSAARLTRTLGPNAQKAEMLLETLKTITADIYSLYFSAVQDKKK
ncbi:MAG: hypothetical protein HXS47_09305 [Theionarchaea archaeon]|nr:hypothetical protein [Theionarchaea archaeon]